MPCVTGSRFFEGRRLVVGFPTPLISDKISIRLLCPKWVSGTLEMLHHSTVNYKSVNNSKFRSQGVTSNNRPTWKQAWPCSSGRETIRVVHMRTWRTNTRNETYETVHQPDYHLFS